MRLVRRCLRELWDLFVDDRITVAALVAWIVAVCLLASRLRPGAVPGLALFAGIAAISVARSGRR